MALLETAAGSKTRKREPGLESWAWTTKKVMVEAVSLLCEECPLYPLLWGVSP